MVFLRGNLRVVEPIFDATFNMAGNVVRLRRHVSMYQWVEEIVDGKPEYRLEWSEQAHPSNRFKQPEGHVNSKSGPLGKRDFTAGRVYLGAFALSGRLLARFNHFGPLRIEDEVRVGRLRDAGDFYYRGRDPDNPEPGDLRVTYQAVSSIPVTLVALQRGHFLDTAYDETMRDITVVKPGRQSPESLYQGTVAVPPRSPWWGRVGSFGLLCIGLFLVSPFGDRSLTFKISGTLLSACAAFCLVLGAAQPGSFEESIAWLAGGVLFASIQFIFHVRRKRAADR
ncbi:MAG: TMEM43 family protein [Acidobacteriota bacterium]|nr:TMEM43 family protein [Acidobacteriota bacterium]